VPGARAADKRPWLERIEAEAVWPMSGKPRELYVDNAAEFKSEALRPDDGDEVTSHPVLDPVITGTHPAVLTADERLKRCRVGGERGHCGADGPHAGLVAHEPARGLLCGP
jgi:hypothetical protein